MPNRTRIARQQVLNSLVHGGFENKRTDTRAKPLAAKAAFHLFFFLSLFLIDINRVDIFG